MTAGVSDMPRLYPAIEACLDQVADRMGDPAEDIYRTLFVQFPDYRDLFALDSDGGVKGNMLATAFDCLLGIAAGETTHALILEASRADHEGYGVAAEDFGVFFSIIRDVCKSALGADWTPDHEREWAALLDQLHSGVIAE